MENENDIFITPYEPFRLLSDRSAELSVRYWRYLDHQGLGISQVNALVGAAWP